MDADGFGEGTLTEASLFAQGNQSLGKRHGAPVSSVE